MSVKVCKFGGTSMADANIIRSVKSIVESDPERRFVVVSAPGKRFSGDKKITDLLFACHKELVKSGSCRKSFSAVRSRFTDIAAQLGLNIDLNAVLDATLERIEREKSEQFTASRGEYLCGLVIAEYLGMPFVDAEDVIFFNDNGTLNAEKSYRAVAAACREGRAVVPGFYGVDENGKVRTFSRGGSDISGAVVARAVNASLYENWTDVSGFLACDPHIVDSPAPIEALSYKELRELSYMGANVLHAESIFPVRKANIPIQIKNTFRPDDAGTTIVPTSRYMPSGRIVTGIAGKKSFTVIYIEKSLMNSEIGFVRKVLSLVEAENVSVEHIPTGIDTMSLLIEDGELTELKLGRILEGIKCEVEPDIIRVMENIALIATVGHGMSSSVGTCARLFKAIAEAEISIKLIDMGSSELNIVVGVKNEDYGRCIKSIYNEFFGG